jgi:CheY-like chemotaxis protein
MKTTVAIFEDDAVNRFLYQRSLERLKHNVDYWIFDNPEKGIQFASQQAFNVIFIEVHFWENFGGIRILKKLQALCPPSTIFVAISSLLQDGDAEKLMAEGFTMCMEKPLAFNESMFRKKAAEQS